jgi:hypothetical protein
MQRRGDSQSRRFGFFGLPVRDELRTNICLSASRFVAFQALEISGEAWKALISDMVAVRGCGLLAAGQIVKNFCDHSAGRSARRAADGGRPDRQS